VGMKTLQDLLVDQLKDLYSAETQLVKALPKMAKVASSDELRAGFETHLGETEGQVERLEQIAERMEISLRGKKCAAMEGLVEEAKELISEKPDENVLDAGLIAAAQKVEHYDIASYGCARTWAQQLGLEDVAELLEETLEEEKATDQKLNDLAMSMVNQQAEMGDGEEEEESSSRSRSRGNGRSRSGGRSKSRASR